MTHVLLIDATEELQAVAHGLEKAGMTLVPTSLEEATQRLADGETFRALLVNMLDSPDGSAFKHLRNAGIGALPPTLGVLRRDDLVQLDLSLPLNDFVTFPAIPEEVVLRVQRLLGTSEGEEDPNLLRRGDLTIDHTSYKVFVGTRPVELTYKEYELLRFLALNEGKVCTREMLLNRVWGYDFYGGARTVDVHIRRLRSKIEDRHHTLIETVRNVGYRFRPS